MNTLDRLIAFFPICNACKFVVYTVVGLLVRILLICLRTLSYFFSFVYGVVSFMGNCHTTCLFFFQIVEIVEFTDNHLLYKDPIYYIHIYTIYIVYTINTA